MDELLGYGVAALVLVGWLAAATLILLFSSRLLIRLRQGEYLRAWRALADGTGLGFQGESFLSSERAEISGSYRQREVSVSANLRGRLGLRDAVMKVVLSVNNRITPTLPNGAFFVIRRDRRGLSPLVRLLDLWRKGGRDEIPEAGQHYLTASVPVNLASHLASRASMQRVLSHPDAIEVVIDGQKMYFRQVGLDKDEDRLRGLLDGLCDLAERFERFSRAWIK